ncbi:hypothetical protein [Dethiobacter alkaliphilus]|uniref:Uncharacterized protein n=1 Tax=Dethiobacter alkaliphilus AHT 1 TaxID=555088 RepID=C0GF08_DETAL|nr:hypothetical protein [Dethiobacter alkaliphilus]EEG78190.1 hypothetical protein DealDRAFT_1067 [Dethiobacter alkaliphilus AHT 1]
MAKDIISEEEWDFGEEQRPTRPPKPPKRSSNGGGGGGGTKDYVIVALIAIIAVMGINNFIYARTGGDAGFAGGGGCCGGGAGGGAAVGGAPANAAELEQLGLNFYFEQTGDEDVDSLRVDVQEFGCHQEIFIYKDGQQVMRIGHSRGQLYLM